MNANWLEDATRDISGAPSRNSRIAEIAVKIEQWLAGDPQAHLMELSESLGSVVRELSSSYGVDFSLVTEEKDGSVKFSITADEELVTFGRIFVAKKWGSNEKKFSIYFQFCGPEPKERDINSIPRYETYDPKTNSLYDIIKKVLKQKRIGMIEGEHEKNKEMVITNSSRINALREIDLILENDDLNQYLELMQTKLSMIIMMLGKEFFFHRDKNTLVVVDKKQDHIFTISIKKDKSRFAPIEPTMLNQRSFYLDVNSIPQATEEKIGDVRHFTIEELLVKAIEKYEYLAHYYDQR